MAGADLTAVRAALREHYVGKNIVDIFYTSNKDINPLLAACEAVADTGEGFGRKLITPIIYGTGTSVGQDFTKVLAKAQSSAIGASGLYSRWETDAQTIEGVARWDRSAMDAVMGRSSGETFKVMTKEMDLKIAAIRKELATYSFGDGTGNLGLVTGATSSTITVGTDVINRVHRGMNLVASATTSGVLINSGTNIGVLGSNPNTGVITLDADPTAGTTWNGKYIFNYNDRPNSALSTYASYVLPHGMAAWLPGASTSDGTGFDGVVRDNISELAGLTCDCSALEPEDAFLKALALLFVTGGTKADALFCNPYDYSAFIANKDKSKTVSISLGKYDLGFDGFVVHSLAGNVPVIPDAMCPAGEFYAGPWKDPELAPRLVYVGDLVQIDNKDGLDFRASATATAYEMRLYFRGNIVMPAPGKFVRGTGLSIS